MESGITSLYISGLTSGIFFIAPMMSILMAPIAILLARKERIDGNRYLSIVIYSLFGYLFSLGIFYTFFVEIYKSDKIFIFDWRSTITFFSGLFYSIVINASAKRLNAKDKNAWGAWALCIPIIGPFLIYGIKKDN